MKMMILAAIAALGLGMGGANAAVHGHAFGSSQSGDRFNFVRGGGG
jgi:hypothetical protein